MKLLRVIALALVLLLLVGCANTGHSSGVSWREINLNNRAHAQTRAWMVEQANFTWAPAPNPREIPLNDRQTLVEYSSDPYSAWFPSRIYLREHATGEKTFLLNDHRYSGEDARVVRVLCERYFLFGLGEETGIYSVFDTVEHRQIPIDFTGGWRIPFAGKHGNVLYFRSGRAPEVTFESGQLYVRTVALPESFEDVTTLVASENIFAAMPLQASWQQYHAQVSPDARFLLVEEVRQRFYSRNVHIFCLQSARRLATIRHRAADFPDTFLCIMFYDNYTVFLTRVYWRDTRQPRDVRTAIQVTLP